MGEVDAWHVDLLGLTFAGMGPNCSWTVKYLLVMWSQ